MATYLLVPVSLPPGIATYAVIDRGPTADGPWIRVGQASVDEASGTGFFYDNTVPFDTPVWYRFGYVTVSGGQIIETFLPGFDEGPLTLASSGMVVLSDPLRPWADIEFGFCETPQTLAAMACSPSAPDFIWSRFGDRVSRSDAGLFDILDAERPADVYARRKDHNGRFLFLTKTLDAIDRVYDLFTVGGPLYLRAPAEYGDFDFALQPGDLVRDYLTGTIDQREPFRLWGAPYTVVDLPLGPQQGPDCANWCDVKAAFPTFADMTAAGGTWADIATGATVCP